MEENASTILPGPIDRPRLFRLVLVCSLLVMGAIIWASRPNLSPNDNSRWNTIWSLVENGTYEIDPVKQLGTIDMVEKDGKKYSSKPPLLPTVIAAVVKPIQAMIREPFAMPDPTDPTKRIFPGLEIYGKTTLFLFNLVPFGLFLWSYRRWLDRLGISDYAWTVSLATAAVGTYVTGYSGTLNNHTIAACFGFLSVSLLLDIWYEKRESWLQFTLAGLLCGWTAANELPAGALAVAALAACLAVDRIRTLSGFCLSLALVAALFFAANYKALGTWTPAYLQKDLYEYKDSYWVGDKKSGIDALNDHPEPYWVYVLNLTIGHHGVFSLTPVLLFAVAGWATVVSGANAKYQGAAWMVFFLSLVVFCFYAFVNDQRNYGGFCHGPRWLIWLIPLWLLWLPYGLESFARDRPARLLVAILLGVSAFSAFNAFINPWTRSWLHRIILWLGWINY